MKLTEKSKLTIAIISIPIGFIQVAIVWTTPLFLGPIAGTALLLLGLALIVSGAIYIFIIIAREYFKKT